MSTVPDPSRRSVVAGVPATILGITSFGLRPAAAAASEPLVGVASASLSLAVTEDRTVQVTWADSGYADHIEYRRSGDQDWTALPTAISPQEVTTTTGWLDTETTATYDFRVVTTSGEASVATDPVSIVSTAAASGGDTISIVEVDGVANRVHVFTTVGADAEFELRFDRTVEYLVVAGGGGGGGAFHGGGGGAGGVRSGSLALTAGTTSVVVGGGGAGATGAGGSLDEGDDGGASEVLGLTALGGGGGGAAKLGVPGEGRPGGSGGGGAFVSTQGASGTDGQGYAGGRGRNTSNPVVRYGGGGGGAGGLGGAAVAGVSGNGGDGGPGIESTITGIAVVYGGGGGGNGHNTGGRAGIGGVGGGGTGQRVAVAATAGTDGLGGGGGAADSGQGASGGSGAVIVRYPIGV